MGLVAALRLATRGEKVTILEATPQIGGLTATWQLQLPDRPEAKVEWDKFYHVVLLSDSKIRSVLADLGLDEQIQWVQTKTGFYSGNQLYSLSSSLDFLRFPPINLYQKLRLGSTIFLGSKIRNWKSMEKLLVEDWLKRWSGKSTFEKVWLPLLRAKLGDAYQRTSAAFIWAYIERMYKARRSGMKRELFGYLPGGYKKITEKLIERLKSMGVDICCSTRVHHIVRENAVGTDCVESKSRGSPSSVMISVSESNSKSPNQEKDLTFDRVLLTVPYPIVSSACDSLTSDEHKRLNDTEYLGVVCTSLLMKKPLTGYYVTNIIDTWVPLTGIIEMGAIVPQEMLDGNYLVYLPQYMLSTDTRMNEADETIHERCLHTLEKMYPHFKRSDVNTIQTARAKYVMAIPKLNHSDNRPDALLSIPGVYLLNSARIVKGTLNVNETLELLEEDFETTIWPNHLQIAEAK